MMLQVLNQEQLSTFLLSISEVTFKVKILSRMLSETVKKNITKYEN